MERELKPHRNFRLQNKKQAFVLVGFKLDRMESLEYIQRKGKEPIVEAVSRLLESEGADVISIRRVYLEQEPEDTNMRQFPLTRSAANLQRSMDESD